MKAEYHSLGATVVLKLDVKDLSADDKMALLRDLLQQTGVLEELQKKKSSRLALDLAWAEAFKKQRAAEEKQRAEQRVRDL